MPSATAPLPTLSAGKAERPSVALSSQDRGPGVRLRQGQTAEKAAEGQPAAQAPGRLVVFNFDNADIEIVLQATSELLVFNYVLAPEARGKKVTVQTTGRIPVDDIFPVLLTILDVNGLSAIKSGNVYRIIAKQGAPQTSTRTVVGAQLDPAVPGDEVMTQVVPLRFVNSVDMVGLLRPFVPQQGALTAHRDTNLLVVTDVASNIRRLLDIVKLVDVDVTSNELQIIQLKHADAQEVAQILTQLFASGRFRSTGPLPAGRRRLRRPWRRSPWRGGSPREGDRVGGAERGAADRRRNVRTR
jgi:general secretion pathway protein D